MDLIILIAVLVFLVVLILFLKLKWLPEHSEKNEWVAKGETGKFFGVTKAKNSNAILYFTGDPEGTGVSVNLDGTLIPCKKGEEKIEFYGIFELFVYHVLGYHWIGTKDVFKFDVTSSDENGTIIKKIGKFFSYYGEMYIPVNKVETKGEIQMDFILRANTEINNLNQIVLWKIFSQAVSSIEIRFIKYANAKTIEDILSDIGEDGVVENSTDFDNVRIKSNTELEEKGISITAIGMKSKEPSDKTILESIRLAKINEEVGKGNLEKAKRETRVIKEVNKQNILKANTEVEIINKVGIAKSDIRKKKWEAVDKNPAAFAAAEEADSTVEALKDKTVLTGFYKGVSPVPTTK